MKEFLRKTRIYLFPTEEEIQEARHLPEVKKILEMLHRDTFGWTAERIKLLEEQTLQEMQCLRKLPFHQFQLAKIFLDRDSAELLKQLKQKLIPLEQKLIHLEKRLNSSKDLEKRYTTWRLNYQKLQESYPRPKDYEAQMKKLNLERHEMEKELETLEKESGLK